MKRRLICSIAAAAALTLTGLAFGQASPGQGPAAQPYPSEQPMPSDRSMPSERQMPSPSTPATPADTATEPSGPSQSEQSTGPAPSATTGAARSGSGSTRLATIVPPGMTAQEACTGFTNVSDCVTSLHAAQNLGLPFADLKARLTGGQQLDAAIHEMKPEVDAKAEVLKAKEQTRADLRPASG